MLDPGLNCRDLNSVPRSLRSLELGASNFPFPYAQTRPWASQSDCYRCPVEFGEREAAESFVVAAAVIAQHADGHGLAEFQRFGGIGAPMHTGHVAANGDIGRQLVEFASDRERRPGVRDQPKAVGGGLDRV